MATILIVDDRPTNREYLITLLGYQGHRLLEAADGREALGLALADPPDLIIADLVMPVMDGYELARQVRAEPRLAQTQIIFLTSSYIVTETRRLAEACGVQFLIAKPAEPEVILATVEAALRTPAAPPQPDAEDFEREHMRLLTDTLAKKVEELEAEIEERKRTEAALRASEARVRSTMDAMLEGAQIINREWCYVYVNEAAAAQGRVPKEQLLGRRMGEVYPGIEQTTLFVALRQCMEGRVVQRFENEFTYPDGSLGWFNLSVQPVAEGVFILSEDITERKRTEERLAYQAEVLEHVRDCIVAADRDLRVTVWNRGAEATYGWAAEEVLGRDVREVFQSEYPQARQAEAERALEGEGQFLVRTIHHRKDGAPFYVEGVIVAQRDAAGEVTRYLYAYRDVSERVRAEQALAANERRFRALIEHAPDGIVLLGADGRGQFASPSVQALMGYRPSEIAGLDPVQLVHPDDRGWLVADLTELGQHPGETITRAYRFRHAHGGWRWLESRVTNLLAEPAVQALIFNFQDITERKEAAAALAQTVELLARAEQIGRIGSWRWDIAADEVEWSDGLYQLFGVERAQFGATYAAYLERVHPEDRERVRAAVEHAYRELAPLEFETRIVRPDQEVRTHYSRAELTVDAHNRPAQLIGMSMDVTERVLRERELEAIAVVSTALRTALGQAEMLPIVLEQVSALLDVSAAALALRDPHTGALRVGLGQGALADLTGQTLRLNAAQIALVLATGEPVVSADAAAAPLPVPAPGLTGAAALVPLIVQQQLLGVLWAGRAGPFSAVEVRVLRAIADIAANALQRAALHEQTEQRLQRLTALSTIDAAIMNSLDLPLTLGIVLEQVLNQLRVDAGDILLLDRARQALEFAQGRGFRSPALERIRLRLGEGFAGQAALERRVVLVPNLRPGNNGFRRAAVLAEDGFRALACAPLMVRGEVVGVLEAFHRTPIEPDADWLAYFQVLAGQAAIAVADARLMNDLQRSNADLRVAYDSTLEGWSAALDLRDQDTEGHSQRVTQMTVRLGRALGMSESELAQVRRGALLHDIGKMGIPDAILHKPGPLTDEEWVIMRQHATYAFQLLSPIDYLRPALDIPYCHHEKWDGSGYPRGLAGEAIPLAARIFAVVDVWDALRSDRPYRSGWPEAEVLAYLQGQAGTHFDPRVVTAFLTLVA